MPKGIKPTAWKGNENSGRKTIAEEMQGAIEKISTEALIELAKNKVFKQLNQEIDFNQTKEMALPITLKGITDKSTITLIKPEPILNVPRNNSHPKDNGDDEKDKDNPGWHWRLKDGVNYPDSDSNGAE